MVQRKNELSEDILEHIRALNELGYGILLKETRAKNKLVKIKEILWKGQGKVHGPAAREGLAKHFPLMEKELITDANPLKYFSDNTRINGQVSMKMSENIYSDISNYLNPHITALYEAMKKNQAIRQKIEQQLNFLEKKAISHEIEPFYENLGNNDEQPMDDTEIPLSKEIEAAIEALNELGSSFRADSPSASRVKLAKEILWKNKGYCTAEKLRIEMNDSKGVEIGDCSPILYYKDRRHLENGEYFIKGTQTHEHVSNYLNQHIKFLYQTIEANPSIESTILKRLTAFDAAKVLPPKKAPVSIQKNKLSENLQKNTSSPRKNIKKETGLSKEVEDAIEAFNELGANIVALGDGYGATRIKEAKRILWKHNGDCGPEELKKEMKDTLELGQLTPEHNYFSFKYYKDGRLVDGKNKIRGTDTHKHFANYLNPHIKVLHQAIQNNPLIKDEILQRLTALDAPYTGTRFRKNPVDKRPVTLNTESQKSSKGATNHVEEARKQIDWLREQKNLLDGKNPDEIKQLLRAIQKEITHKNWDTWRRKFGFSHSLPTHASEILQCIEEGLKDNKEPSKTFQDILGIAKKALRTTRITRSEDTKKFYEDLIKGELPAYGKKQTDQKFQG